MGWRASTRRRGELDIDQRAEKRSRGSLSEKRPEDKVMGRDLAGGPASVPWIPYCPSPATEAPEGSPSSLPQDKEHVGTAPMVPAPCGPDATSSLQALSLWGQQTCPRPAFSVSPSPALMSPSPLQTQISISSPNSSTEMVPEGKLFHSIKK